MTITAISDWMTQAEVEAEFKIPVATLAEQRGRRTHGRHGEQGPEFYKIGRSVRYKRADVVAWLESKRVA